MFLVVYSSITDPSQKENLGIVVQYKVKVRLIVGGVTAALSGRYGI